MRCFGSCEFLRRLWVDISGYKYSEEDWCEEPGNYRKNDSHASTKNDLHDFHDAAEKPVQELFTILLMPTQNCLADFTTKASVKADDLITTVRI